MNFQSGIIYLPFLFAFAASLCVRPYCPYYKQHTQHQLFDEIFIEQLMNKLQPILSIEYENYRIVVNDTQQTCFRREELPNILTTEQKEWCTKRPCYYLHIKPCCNFSLTIFSGN